MTQIKLLKDEPFIPRENPDLSQAERDRLADRLVKLGDMMGDGLHHEDPWIEKEYASTLYLLYPDIKKRRRLAKNKAIDESMAELIEKVGCKACGGKLRQGRSGSYIAYCIDCNTRHKATKKK